jgi:hypothetical protein
MERSTHLMPPSPPHRVTSNASPVRRWRVKRASSGLLTFGFALPLCLSASCGVSGSSPFSESRGEVYSDCSSMWGSDHTLTIYTWWQTDTKNQDCDLVGGEACAASSLNSSTKRTRTKP